MKIDRPLRFHHLLKRALWGGTRLERELFKSTGGVSDAAESWEVCDLPGNISIVDSGPLAGQSLRQLMEHSVADLLGRHASQQQFPLLIKFLDAHQQLSVQVHPKKPTRMPDGSIRPGKAECWIVIDADPGNRMFLGLREGVSRQQLLTAITQGRLEECLHHYQAQPGDCIYLEPGTVHALGGGLLIAEIQQPSDITYRLHDWGRTDSYGRPRELHLEQGLAATNFDSGPVLPVVPQKFPRRTRSEVLVECPHFIINRHFGLETLTLTDDDAMHVFVALNGTVRQGDFQLQRGQTAVVPAARAESTWELSPDAVLIDAHLPC